MPKSPTIFGSIAAGSSSTMAPSAPTAAPTQKLPLMTRFGPAANPGGDQFLDGGVDRGVFPHDARARHKSEQRKTPETPPRPQRRRRSRHEIDRQRDEKQLLAAEPVCQPTEEQRAGHRTGKIRSCREAYIGVAEFQEEIWGAHERPSYCTGQRHLETIENPGNAQGGYHKRVKAAPRQPIEPGGNVGFDDLFSHTLRTRRNGEHFQTQSAAGYPAADLCRDIRFVTASRKRGCVRADKTIPQRGRRDCRR